MITIQVIIIKFIKLPITKCDQRQRIIFLESKKIILSFWANNMTV